MNERSARPAANRLKVEQLVEAVEVLPITIGSAARFGVFKQQLVSRGRVKADIDLHIAAKAVETGATVVTNDGALLAGDIEDSWPRTGSDPRRSSSSVDSMDLGPTDPSR